MAIDYRELAQEFVDPRAVAFIREKAVAFDPMFRDVDPILVALYCCVELADCQTFIDVPRVVQTVAAALTPEQFARLDAFTAKTKAEGGLFDTTAELPQDHVADFVAQSTPELMMWLGRSNLQTRLQVEFPGTVWTTERMCGAYLAYWYCRTNAFPGLERSLLRYLGPEGPAILAWMTAQGVPILGKLNDAAAASD